MANTPDNNQLISSFGRRRGRALPPHKRMLADELLPLIEIEKPEKAVDSLSSFFDVIPAQAGTQIGQDWIPAFAGITDYSAFHLEIGFGAGEHLAAMAAANPKIGYIGCEPFFNGIGNLLVMIEAQKLSNIRLFVDDARLLLPLLPPASIAHIDILFPDPWPKPRHHKRRLITQQMLSMLARLQPAGGTLLLATDHEDYGAWMLEQVLAHPDYYWNPQSHTDWQTPPDNWVQTRYQHKTTLQGRKPLFLKCVRAA